MKRWWENLREDNNVKCVCVHNQYKKIKFQKKISISVIDKSSAPYPLNQWLDKTWG